MATVILPKGEGQLGNRLFQFATFHAASLEAGFDLWNPAFGDYANHFPAVAKDVFCRPFHTRPLAGNRRLARLLFETLSGRRLRGLLRPFGGRVLDITSTHDANDLDYDLESEDFARHLKQSRLLIACGWKFRARGALWRQREKLREIFSPHSRLLESARESAAKAKGDADLLIGVHVRRGDYAGWQGGRYFFDWEGYADWMRQAVELRADRKVAFLVCSNETPHRLPALDGARISPGPGGVIEDLYSLASCDLLMGPPSTFTLWASFWGGVRLHMLENAGQALWTGGFILHPHV